MPVVALPDPTHDEGRPGERAALNVNNGYGPSLATSPRVRRGTRLMVVQVNQNLTYISGYGARELIVEISGRAPTYSSLGKAWCVQPRTARDVMALAERRFYDVQESWDDPLPAARGVLW